MRSLAWCQMCDVMCCEVLVCEFLGMGRGGWVVKREARGVMPAGAEIEAWGLVGDGAGIYLLFGGITGGEMCSCDLGTTLNRPDPYVHTLRLRRALPVGNVARACYLRTHVSSPALLQHALSRKAPSGAAGHTCSRDETSTRAARGNSAPGEEPGFLPRRGGFCG